MWERQGLEIRGIVFLVWEKSCKTSQPLVLLAPKTGLTMKRKRRAKEEVYFSDLYNFPLPGSVILCPLLILGEEAPTPGSLLRALR